MQKQKQKNTKTIEKANNFGDELIKDATNKVEKDNKQIKEEIKIIRENIKNIKKDITELRNEKNKFGLKYKDKNGKTRTRYNPEEKIRIEAINHKINELRSESSAKEREIDIKKHKISLNEVYLKIFINSIKTKENAREIKPEEPVAKKTEEPAAKKPEEPVAKKTEEPAVKKPEEPVAKKPEEPAVKKPEEPVAKKPEEPVAKKTEEPVAKKPEEPVNNNKKISKIDIDEFTGGVKFFGEDGKEIDTRSFEYDPEENDFISNKTINVGENTKETLNEFIDVVCTKYSKFDPEKIDPRITEILVERNDIEIFKKYILALADKEAKMPFDLSYDLTDIYKSERPLKDIKKIQKFSRFAKKQNNEKVSVYKDNILKRAYLRIKKGLQERSETKELTSGETIKRKEINTVKKAITGAYRNARIHGMYLRGKLTKENTLRTKSKIRNFKDQYKVNVSEAKGKESVKFEGKEAPVSDREPADE